MEEQGKDPLNQIKSSLEGLLNTKTVLKPKRSNKIDKERENFEKLIMTLEELEIRAYFLENDLDLDLSKYDSKFYSVIDSLIELHFGPKITQIIMFYLYDRKKDDGTLSVLTDDTGRTLPLENPADLWNLIQVIKQSKK